MHLESLFGDRLERGTARGTAHLALQAEPLGHQRGAALIELPELGRSGDAEGPPQNDAYGDGEETEEHEREPAAPASPPRYAARRHARSFALRARGFRATSSGVPTIARRVITSPRE